MTPSYSEGTIHAVQFYGGITKYFVPDNLKAAVTKHSKDELVLQSVYSDLEDFYETIVLPVSSPCTGTALKEAALVRVFLLPKYRFGYSHDSSVSCGLDCTELHADQS